MCVCVWSVQGVSRLWPEMLAKAPASRDPSEDKTGWKMDVKKKSLLHVSCSGFHWLTKVKISICRQAQHPWTFFYDFHDSFIITGQEYNVSEDRYSIERFVLQRFHLFSGLWISVISDFLRKCTCECVIDLPFTLAAWYSPDLNHYGAPEWSTASDVQ